MRYAFKPVALGLCLAMGLSACQTTGSSDANLTPEEQRMRQQADTYNTTMIEGAVIGCAAGAILGALLSKNRAQGAAIGCGAGGIVGGGAGAYVAGKQEEYSNKEQQIDAMIQDVRSENARLAELSASVRQVAAQDKARIAQIESDYAKGVISQQEAQSRLKTVDANTAYIDNALAELKKRRDTYREASQEINITDSRQKRDMQAEIRKLESQIAQMEAERNALVQRRTVSRVG